MYWHTIITSLRADIPGGLNANEHNIYDTVEKPVWKKMRTESDSLSLVDLAGNGCHPKDKHIEMISLGRLFILNIIL